MIVQRTTFVVGAGASVPYVLPVAKKLFEQAQDLTPQSDAFQLAHCVTRNLDVIERTISQLRRHRGPSIDTFLEQRPTQPAIITTGKVLLVSRI